MSKYLHTTVEFYSSDNKILSGHVFAENGESVYVKVQHGKLHGEDFIVMVDDIIDHSYDKYVSDDDKMYTWGGED